MSAVQAREVRSGSVQESHPQRRPDRPSQRRAVLDPDDLDLEVAEEDGPAACLGTPSSSGTPAGAASWSAQGASNQNQRRQQQQQQHTRKSSKHARTSSSERVARAGDGGDGGEVTGGGSGSTGRTPAEEVSLSNSRHKQEGVAGSPKVCHLCCVCSRSVFFCVQKTGHLSAAPLTA